MDATDMDTGIGETVRVEEARFAAVARRDRSADGRFVFAVRTTGIYCRPSCPARPALRRNVVFFPDAAAAASAGFRPCRRCRPDADAADGAGRRDHARVALACRLIDGAEAGAPPALAALARAAGLSPWHFHRVFRRVTGVTPKAYADGRRAERLRTALGAGGSVTAAGYDAGFNASSRLYADAPRRLGMRPATYRCGGKGVTVAVAIRPSSLGLVLVAATASGIAAIALGDEADALRQDLARRFPHATLRDGDAAFEALVARAVALVETPGVPCELPLDVRGTAFQLRVWQALQAIPAGRTSSYAAVAAAVGAPGAARAVARACADNRLAVAIPCHRVVRGDGALSGYRWGVARKRALLDREAGSSETVLRAVDDA